MRRARWATHCGSRIATSDLVNDRLPGAIRFRHAGFLDANNGGDTRSNFGYQQCQGGYDLLNNLDVKLHDGIVVRYRPDRRPVAGSSRFDR